MLAAGAGLLVGAAGCSAKDDATPASSASTVAGAPGGGGGAATAVDPCQWYTAETMSSLVGFTVTMEKKETQQGLGAECLYDSQEKFTGITVRPITAASYDQLKAGATATGLGGKQIDFPGVGDAAYHNGAPDSTNPSVSFSAKKGSSGIQVELATASSGPIKTIDQSITLTSTIAKKALG